MRAVKYIFTLLLCAAMLLAALPLASAAEYTVVGKNTVNIPVPGYEPGSVSTNCWTFAQAIYKIIWDENFSGIRGDGDDMLRSVPLGQSRAITVENTKRFISAARPGASIRISQIVDGGDDVGGYRHSQILVYRDDNGFAVYEGSINGKVRLKYYTWEEYAGGYFGRHYGYFKYIKWPDAPAFDDDSVYSMLNVSAEYNGSSLKDAGDYVTFDVYIDGVLKADDVSAFSDVFRKGTVYDLRDVRTAPCVTYSFTRSEAICGTVGAENTSAILFLTDDHAWGTAQSLNGETHRLTCANDSTHTVTEPHTWNGGELTLAPTRDAEGEMTYTCTVCGEKKTEAVPAAAVLLTLTDGHAKPGEAVMLTVTAPDAEVLSRLTPVFDETVFTMTGGLIPQLGAEDPNSCSALLVLTVNEKALCGNYTVTLTGENLAVPGATLTVDDPDALPEFLAGDVNNDGVVSAADARLALRATVLLEDFAPRTVSFLACDTDGDECLTSADARRILRATVGLEELGDTL